MNTTLTVLVQIILKKENNNININIKTLVLQIFLLGVSELWPIFGSPILITFEVTDRSVSISLWRKAEQQSIAVLHSRQCHCSTISVPIV